MDTAHYKETNYYYYYYYQELPKTMSKQTMTSLDWNKLLLDNPELLKIMPTELKTPWLCHIALQRSDNHLRPEDGDKHVPEHLRDAVSRLSNWEDETYLEEDDEYRNDNEYSWKTPYERPFNETGEIDVSKEASCIVCGGTPDGTISKNYFAINGLHCCDNCYEEHIKHVTRTIMWNKPYTYANGEIVHWNTARCSDMTSLVKPNTELVYTRHPLGIPEEYEEDEDEEDEEEEDEEDY